MTPAFRAGKPTLTTHPVAGGDALMFPIVPSPPEWWWRVLRHHLADDTALTRPWDQQQDSRIAVVCPSLERLGEVIDAINAAVDASNRDYERELALESEAAAQLRTAEAERERHLSDIQHALDRRYPNVPVPVTAVEGQGRRDG